MNNYPNYPQNYPPMPPAQPPKKKRKGLIIGCASLVVLVALCGIIAAISSSGKSTPATQTTNTQQTTTPTKPASWQTTHTYSGNGSKKTETFTVGNDWKIKWSCDPTSFSGMDYNVIISVMNSDATPLDYAAVNTMCKSGNSSGETEEHRGGTVYLDISSEADWSISILESK